MRNPWIVLPAALTLLALSACGDHGGPEQATMAYGAAAPTAKMESADAAQPGSDPANAGQGLAAMLAYEHHVGVQLEAQLIQNRQQAVQAACNEGRFGACVVLNMNQQGGDRPSASVTVRIVPEGVEPMIALAGEGARVGSRSTHAEDLAVAVRDNAQMEDRLQREMERLQQFQQRPDLAVADMIALSERLASVEAQLESVAREGAQYQRRIQTQLLTMNFHPPSMESGRSEVGQAIREAVGTLSLGTAWTIRTVAFLAPMVLGLAVLVLVIRRIRRRRRP